VYMNGSKTAPAVAMTSATLSFAMPMAPGSYEMRLMYNNSYTVLATSATINVGP